MIQRNSMIPRSLMIQREFQLEVWTLIIQKYTVIPPSSMVLFGCAYPISDETTICNLKNILDNKLFGKALVLSVSCVWPLLDLLNLSQNAACEDRLTCTSSKNLIPSRIHRIRQHRFKGNSVKAAMRCGRFLRRLLALAMLLDAILTWPTDDFNVKILLS